ncbi:MAG: ABC transporter substrate-binding protein [Chitinophagales bacterium]
MISAPSRRLLLNGNNLLVLLFILVGISSCAAKKITASELSTSSGKNMEVVSINTPKETAALVMDDSFNRKPVIFDLDSESASPKPEQTEPVSLKTQDGIYNVAVMLPFNLDQIPLGKYADDTTKQLSIDSKNAIEFYLGCQMAREKFEGKKSTTNVYFLDSKNDSSTMEALFQHKPFPNVDYIIGPLYFTTLSLAADLAKQRGIPMISPLANSMYIRNNPFYYNANASLRGQYSFLLETIKTSYPGKTVEVIYDGKDSLAESIQTLKDIAGNYFSYGNISFTSLQTWEDVTKTMVKPDSVSERVILIYSSKESYVKTILAKLKPIKNPLRIFTSSCLKNAKSPVDSKFPHSVFTTYPYNNKTPNAAVFAAKYEEKFIKKPSEIAYQGYDIMTYLFQIIENNRELSNSTFNFSNNFDLTQIKLQFKPVLNKNGEINYYDNTIVYLYKYVNGIFEIATP